KRSIGGGATTWRCPGSRAPPRPLAAMRAKRRAVGASRAPPRPRRCCYVSSLHVTIALLAVVSTAFTWSVMAAAFAGQGHDALRDALARRNSEWTVGVPGSRKLRSTPQSGMAAAHHSHADPA